MTKRPPTAPDDGPSIDAAALRANSDETTLATPPRSGKRPRSGPSGPTQPEAARKAKQRLLRLLPDIDEAAERRAKGLGLSVSGYVSGLIVADAATVESRIKHAFCDEESGP